MTSHFSKFIGLAAILTVSLGGKAKASSPGAWAELESRIRTDCFNKFQAVAGKDASQPKIIVDPTAGETVIAGLIRYDYKKTPVTMLCLYSKSEKKVIELFEIKDPSIQKNWTPLKAALN
jgi:hypothetical protein